MANEKERWTADGETATVPIFLRDPLGALRRRWRAMLVVLVVVAAGGVGSALLGVEPLYVARATLSITGQQIPEDFVRPTVLRETTEQIDAMVGEMLSRDQLVRVVEAHGLYPEVRATGSMGEAVSLLRSRVHISAGDTVATGRARRNQPAALYRLAFADRDPQVAAAVANELASTFVTAAMRQRTEQARLTTEFLRKQLASAEEALRAKDAEITRFKEQARGSLPSELESNLRKLERLQQQRQSLALQIADAQSRLALLAATPTTAPDSPEARLAAVRARLTEQLAVHTPEHPNVVSLRRQVESLEAEVAGGGESGSGTRREMLAAGRRQVESLHAQLAETEASIRLVDSLVAETPANQEKLAALEQRADVLRASYRDFLEKVQNAELAENLETAEQGLRVSVLDRASPPGSTETTRVKYLVATVVGAFGLAGLAGILLEVRDPVIVDDAEIESALDLPVLGSVPRIT
jgi:polysaccharide biosynthesis transport protein